MNKTAQMRAALIALGEEQPTLRVHLRPVIARIDVIAAQGEEEAEDTKAPSGGKKTPGGKMIQFLNERGDERVTNPDTGNQVKIKSLGRGPKSKKYQQELFQKWLEDQDNGDSGSKPKPKSKSKPKPKKTEESASEESGGSSSSPSTTPAPATGKSLRLGVTEAQITAARETYAKTLTKVQEQVSSVTTEQALANYADGKATWRPVESDSRLHSLLESLPPEELRLHDMSDQIGREMAKAWKKASRKVANTYARYFTSTQKDSWVTHSGSDRSFEVRGVLASMGIETDVSADYLTDSQRNAYNKAKENPPEALRAAIQEAYTMTQAVFQELGITEVTLYRGVTEQTAGMEEGDEVGLETFGVSSWTINPRVAEDFGSVVEAKIPVERIFGGFTNALEFGKSRKARYGEAELMVFGGEPIESKLVIQK